MRIHLVGAITVCGLSLSTGEMRGGNVDTYPHGEITCLQGNEGPGIKLLLTQSNRCEEEMSYPHLEVDIKESQIKAHKSIVIGADNLAFRCLNPKDACEQSLGDHFQEKVGKEIRTDGAYDLRFRSGIESGRFQEDCFAPCA